MVVVFSFHSLSTGILSDIRPVVCVCVYREGGVCEGVVTQWLGVASELEDMG